jgi:hypothetical protein
MLDRRAGDGWRDDIALEYSGVDYGVTVDTVSVDGVPLDPVYEQHAARFCDPGDALLVVASRPTLSPDWRDRLPLCRWIAGDSAVVLDTTRSADDMVDFVFSCPPYGDLEQYSDDPADLSNMDDDAFDATYRDIIEKAVARLRDHRFAVFVVGDYRDKGGFMRHLVGTTVRAFEAAGARYYNEAILVSPAGTLQLRVTKQFDGSRKLGKQHQTILVFVKGDPKRATAWLRGEAMDDAPKPKRTRQTSKKAAKMTVPTDTDTIPRTPLTAPVVDDLPDGITTTSIAEPGDDFWDGLNMADDGGVE